MRGSDSTLPAPAERTGTALFVVATVGAALLFGGVASFRGVNADEGFYLAAGKEIAAGARPYADFFFPQMPYLVWLEALAFEWTGVSLFVGRILSALPAAVLAGVLAATASRRSGRASVGIVVALAYVLHVLILTYVTVVKTYGLSNLFLVCAALLVSADLPSWRRAAAAGVCVALSVGIRLPTIVVVLPLLATCWVSDRKLLWAFGIGAFIAALPLLVIAAHDLQAFWFDNVAFHELRREVSGFVPILTQKAGVLLRWVFVPQNALVWCLGFVGFAMGARRERLAMACAVAIGTIYLYATPTYLEYMVQVIPFLLLAAVPAVAALVARPRFLGALALVYVLGLGVALRPAAEGSMRAEKLQLWNLVNVESVAGYVRERGSEAGPVLSWWEGYPVLAGVEGFGEVGFWQSNVAKKLSPELRRRYHVAAEDDVRELIATRRPALIVCPQDVWVDLRGVIAAGYDEAARFGDVQIFERRNGGAAEPPRS